MTNNNNIKDDPDVYEHYKYMLQNREKGFAGYYYVFDGDTVVKEGY